jgi:ABC-type multidrug transport system fused ATPase/permease subunit
MIQKLRALLTKRDKQYLLFLLIFSIFISIMETFSISIIMPFISVASNFDLINTNKYYNIVYTFLNISTHIDFVIYFGVFLILFYIIRGLINIFYSYLLINFTSSRYHLIVYRLFENYLGMKYRDFIETSSSDIQKNIIQEAGYVTAIVSAILFMVSEIFIIIFIYSMMIYVNYKITFFLTVILGFSALFLVKVIVPYIKRAGTTREKNHKDFYKILSHSIGNFKLIKLQSNTNDILKQFSLASYEVSRANTTNTTLQGIPRVFLEMVGFSVVSFIVIFIVFKYQNDISNSMSLISMFILGLYRLMPSANRILTSYNEIMFYRKSLDIIHNELMYESEDLKNNNILFKNTISLQNIDFGYIQDKLILQNTSLDIKKGSSIAFIGKSGSGKSTLVDIIIGLYRPINGSIKVDNVLLDHTNIKSWRQKIGYIPQSVYLFDGSVANNVAFGHNMNIQRVKEVLKKANILDFLEKNQNGIDTIVGDGGIKLSGGQKQRIAIARALYANPDILVLDEATSALDNETEALIMDEIYDISKDKTLIIIAHRLSTTIRCDKIYEIKNKNLQLV